LQDVPQEEGPGGSSKKLPAGQLVQALGPKVLQPSQV